MYDYRQMTPKQRAAVVAERKKRGYPWHAPPHLGGQEETYLVSAACYEHREVLTTVSRLEEFTKALIEGMKTRPGGEVHGWVILPSHYHVLATVDLARLSPWIARLHNGKSTQWNREDNTAGRTVWYRFSDRRIRSERHYYASLNYLHANPVKHGYVRKADQWPWSSFHEYLEQVGRDVLVDWWRRYPVRRYGRRWDE